MTIEQVVDEAIEKITHEAVRQVSAKFTEFYRWLPISEIHEDYGQCVLIDIRDPGHMAVGNNLDLNFDSQGWTHFTRITPLSSTEAEKLKMEMSS